MAPNLIYFLSILSIILTSPQIHARNTKFVTVDPHQENPSPNIPQTTQQHATTEDQDPSFVRQTGNGYGLYGRESNQNNSNNDDDDKVTNTSDTNTRPTSQSPPDNSNYNERNKYYYSKDAYGNREEGNDPKNNRGNGYDDVVEKQGMGDTRFVEDGKYFYDVESENNNNHNNNYYYNNNPNQYYGSSYDNNVGSFDSNTERINNQQEGFQEEQNEFEP